MNPIFAWVPVACGGGVPVAGSGVPGRGGPPLVVRDEFALNVGRWEAASCVERSFACASRPGRPRGLSELRCVARALADEAQDQPHKAQEAADAAVSYAWEAVRNICRGVLPTECWPLNDPEFVTQPPCEQLSHHRHLKRSISLDENIPVMVVDASVKSEFVERIRNVGSRLVMHQSRDLVGDVRPVSKLALQSIEMYDAEFIRYIHAYVDGPRSDSRSGWGGVHPCHHRWGW